MATIKLIDVEWRDCVPADICRDVLEVKVPDRVYDPMVDTLYEKLGELLEKELGATYGEGVKSFKLLFAPKTNEELENGRQGRSE